MTLLTIFHKAAEEFPEKGIGYIQEHGEQVFGTYRELKEEAAKILGGYRELGLTAGDKVILALSQKQEFIPAFWGCILGGMISIPLPAPTSLNRANPQGKLEQVAKFLDYPPIFLDGKLLSEKAITVIPREQLFSLRHLQSREAATAFHQPSPQDLALIQFSSGTTGTPKGVCLTHQNIIANLAAIAQGMELVQEDVGLSWLPLSHDMGLIGFHLVPLYVGNNQLHLDAYTFIKYPLLWLESIEKHGATITAAPNFSQALILERLKRQPDKKYNLASIRLLFNGAEPISVDLMTRFMTEMGGHGLKSTAMFPVYGLAEATLAVTFPPLKQTPKIETLSRRQLQRSQQAVISQEAEEVIMFVSVGVPVSGCQIRIVGEGEQLLAEGYVGEIQIKGENVTSGYYNRDPEPEWLATGDLGYLRDGYLYVTGRSKDIIFLHGQNYYAHDLENIACEVPGVKLGRVVLWGSFDEKLGRDQVLLFLRGEAELFWQVQQHLRRVTGLEVDVMIPLKSFPKTSSGKLQRYKLGQQFAAGEFTQVIQEMAQLLEEVKAQRRQEKIAPSTFTEKLFHRVWCEELLLPPEDVGIEDTFTELGGNSLRMAFVIQKLAKQYQVPLDQETWAEYPTIGELAAYLDQRSTIGVKTRRGVFKG